MLTALHFYYPDLENWQKGRDDLTGICAGIVTYQPNPDRLKHSLKRISNQLERVYIVDNHSSDIEEIRKVISLFENAELIENKGNYGIAKALNQMCEKARINGFSWILTLDQDTVVQKNLIETFSPYISDPQLGIICPDVYYEGWGNKQGKGTGTQYVYACMTSASLTRVDAWYDVGGFREDYFIDFVDNEFCMKLYLHNYKILRVFSTCISHQLGESGIKKILWFKIRYSRHSYIRLYYMARNNALFIKEYKEYLPVFKEILKLNYVLFNEFLVADKKIKALKYIKRGILDAHKGILGKYKDN